MTNDQKEQLRQATLEVLVACFPVARALPALRRNVARELVFSFDDSDLVAALAFLTDLRLVETSVDDLGSTNRYRATPAGCLKVERSQ